MILEQDVVCLIDGKPKGKALSWLHSKPEHTELSANDLLGALNKIFFRKVDKIKLRKQCQNLGKCVKLY